MHTHTHIYIYIYIYANPPPWSTLLLKIDAKTDNNSTILHVTRVLNISFSFHINNIVSFSSTRNTNGGGSQQQNEYVLNYLFVKWPWAPIDYISTPITLEYSCKYRCKHIISSCNYQSYDKWFWLKLIQMLWNNTNWDYYEYY